MSTGNRSQWVCDDEWHDIAIALDAQSRGNTGMNSKAAAKTSDVADAVVSGAVSPAERISNQSPNPRATRKAIIRAISIIQSPLVCLCLDSVQFVSAAVLGFCIGFDCRLRIESSSHWGEVLTICTMIILAAATVADIVRSMVRSVRSLRGKGQAENRRIR